MKREPFIELNQVLELKDGTTINVTQFEGYVYDINNNKYPLQELMRVIYTQEDIDQMKKIGEELIKSFS